MNRRTPLRSRTRLRAVNPERKKENFARAYHSQARVKFVKRLPCCLCGIRGYTDNAHTENGGRSRKGHYTTITPLCHERPDRTNPTGEMWPGCHYLFDNHKLTPALRERAIEHAELTETLWLEHLKGESN